MIQNTITQYIDTYVQNGTPFHTYYMTVSGHGGYGWGHAMAAKNRAKAQAAYPNASPQVQAYVAANLELENALAYLVNALEQAGIADDTVICLAADHYPYLLSETDTDYYNELRGFTDSERDTSRYRNALILWCGGMEEAVTVSEPCSAVDIVPTLSNLFGLEYDSRLLSGRDVLDQDYDPADAYGSIPLVILPTAAGNSWATAAGVYESSTRTFTANPGYDYGFSATVNDEYIDVIDNGDGSYTVENVTGKLVISANSTPTIKTYAVTVEGDGSGDVSASTSATHGLDYTFTVTQAANYDYAVAVTVNGQPVTCTVSNSGSNAYTYTIPAKSVTGPVVITVKKAPQSGTTQIVLAGSGAADVWDGVTSYTVKSGEAFTFGINHQDGFDYTVIVMVGEKTLTLQRNEGSTSTYTIPGDYIKGGIIMVTITKTSQLALTVDAVEYVKYTDGSVVWLITAVPETKLPATKSLYYGDTAMFWSGKYEAYAWLLVGKGTAADIAAAAKSAISVKGNSTVSVSYSGDVNGTGHIDINDAQYVYDLYNAKHSALDMEKFLRCDVNGNREVSVDDVQAVVSLLLH